MNLNDFHSFIQIDADNMLAQIDDLPEQLQSAWKLGQNLDLPAWDGIQRVIIAGMGGSAIGADLLASYVAPHCRVPVVVHRDYDLPAWAHGSETLLIASSHSGNTEETLHAFKQGKAGNCRCLTITTGGELAAIATKSGIPTWIFEHHGQPRAAVGFSFGMLLAAFTRLGLIANPSNELVNAITTMQQQQAQLKADVPVTQNPAKRMAGQLMGRWVCVFGAGLLSPVARRWKGQVSELAKAWGQFEFLPEADHNTLAGTLNPEDTLTRMMVLFLRSPSDHPRNRLRSDLTREVFVQEGINTDFVDAEGDTSLAHQWTMLHFGDYMAYYLAIAYGVDPTPVAALESFKLAMQAA